MNKKLHRVTKNSSITYRALLKNNVPFRNLLNDIEPLQYCQTLNKLELSGGIGNALKINTLDPLKQLVNLKYLSLTNIRVKDGSLEPVTCLKNLLEIKISNQFPTEEYAKLSVALPETKCDYFHPYVKLNDSIDGKDIMVIGKRKPFLNAILDIKKLEKYDEQFKAFQEKYKAAMYIKNPK